MYIPLKKPLPTMNELIAWAKIRIGKGSKYDKEKKEYEKPLVALMLEEKKKHGYEMPCFLVGIEITWSALNMRKDPDGIAAARKLVLDAMQTAGLLRKDSYKYVSGGLVDLFMISIEPFIAVRFIKPMPVGTCPDCGKKIFTHGLWCDEVLNDQGKIC